MLNRYVQEWLDALRSGEFQQTTEVLKDGDSYCCLGVACHLSLKNEWPVDREEVKRALEREVGLPESVRQLLGLADGSGAYAEYDGTVSLADDNDNGCTFDEIADLIERKPPGLFAYE